MLLSEYVVVDTKGAFLDTLGFMRPAGAFQASLFKQFTVLSNHPAYHGVLCSIWRFLQDNGGSPGQPGFSRRFREVEIFWGLLNALQGIAVLNVRKYKRLAEDDSYSLHKVPQQHSLYARLAYGTLGHYTQPSISWGFLAPGGKAISEEGIKLAQAMEDRCPKGLQHWFARWAQGEAIDTAQCAELAQGLNLHASATAAEQVVWKSQIGRWVEANPKTKPIWETPVPLAELDEAQASPEAYVAQYARLVQRYPTLEADIVAMAEFERLAGAVQFLFDRKLLGLQYTSGKAHGEPSIVGELPAAMVKVAARVAARGGAFEPAKLYSTLAQTQPTLVAVETAICDHHIRHQKRKGVSPFLDETGLLVRDTVDRAGYADLLESMDNSASVDGAMDKLQFRSRRDWHFRRCRVYSDWAAGGAA